MDLHRCGCRLPAAEIPAPSSLCAAAHQNRVAYAPGPGRRAAAAYAAAWERLTDGPCSRLATGRRCNTSRGATSFVDSDLWSARAFASLRAGPRKLTVDAGATSAARARSAGEVVAPNASRHLRRRAVDETVAFTGLR